MSKYERLAEYLASHKGNSWEASFAEIEAKIGEELPPSAYKHQAWWANQSGKGHSQTRGWRSVGWRTSKLDLERHRVRFERERRTSPDVAAVELGHGRNDAPPSLAGLVDQAKAISGIDDRDEILRAALRQFIEREAAKGLIELGGTMPDFEAAPRKRWWR